MAEKKSYAHVKCIEFAGRDMWISVCASLIIDPVFEWAVSVCTQINDTDKLRAAFNTHMHINSLDLGPADQWSAEVWLRGNQLFLPQVKVCFSPSVFVCFPQQVSVSTRILREPMWRGRGKGGKSKKRKKHSRYKVDQWNETLKVTAVWVAFCLPTLVLSGIWTRQRFHL